MPDDAYLAIQNAIPDKKFHYFSTFIGKIARNPAFRKYLKCTMFQRARSCNKVKLQEYGKIYVFSKVF